MDVFEKVIHAEGHLIDSDLLSQVMDRIIREGSRFKILNLEVGETNEDTSKIDMVVSADTEEELVEILEQLSDLGFTEHGHLQEWIAKMLKSLGEELPIIHSPNGAPYVSPRQGHGYLDSITSPSPERAF